MKPLFLRSFVKALCVGALVVSARGQLSPVWAQPTPVTPTTEAPETDTPLDIDPLAKKAFEAVIERYKNLHSYSDVMTLESKNGVDWVAEETWERPNKAVVVRKKGTSVWRSVSDGTTLWAVVPEHAEYYLKRATEAERFFMAFNESDTGGPGSGFVQGDYGLEQMQKEGLRVLRFQGEAKVDGIRCQLITAKIEFAEGSTAVITTYIGVEDGLIHQVTADYGGRGRGMQMVEKHTDIRLNPELPADTWKFVPPAGLKPIEYYSSLEPHRFDLLYKAGDPLPSFESTDLNGKKISLNDLADGDKLVLIHFFTTRDAFEVKRLNQLLEQYKEKGFAIVGVSMDGRRSAVEQFVKDNHINYPVVFDGQGWQNAVAVKYGVRSLPHILLVGRDGRLLLVGRGSYDIEFGTTLSKALNVPNLIVTQ